MLRHGAGRDVTSTGTRVRFAPPKIETGAAAPAPQSSRGEMMPTTPVTAPLTPRTPSHLQLSPDGRLMVAEGRQDKSGEAIVT
jgi:hypothetical protein